MSDDWKYIARETWGNLTPEQKQQILLAQFEKERREEFRDTWGALGFVVVSLLGIAGLIALGSWANGWTW